MLLRSTYTSRTLPISAVVCNIRIILRRRCLSSTTRRSAAEPKKAVPPEKWGNTLLLPKTPFPMRADPIVQAERFQQRTTEDLYRWQWENAKGELFVLHDGPPYANGNLHIGHALNKILKDIINRFQVMQGRRVNYIPGWDCHGLPIENKALKNLNADARSIPPNQIRDASRDLAEEQIGIQREEFQKMAIMADWSQESTYRTFDHDYEIRQLRLFQQMVAKGLVYRRFRPVYWSPASGTALAEAELKYEGDHKSRAVYVEFSVEREHMSSALRLAAEAQGLDSLSLLIWTTTPWTLPANMAVAVHADLMYSIVRNEVSEVFLVGHDRLGPLQDILGQLDVLTQLPGASIVGTKYSHFFQPEGAASNPVFAASYVTAESGTGLVHAAPGHGAEDYFALRASGLLLEKDILSPVDGEGRFSSDIIGLLPEEELGQQLVGLSVLDGGNAAILDALRSSGTLLAEQEIKHRYPYDWKTKTPVIIRATSQWFANIDEIKDAAIYALKDVQFHPVQSRARLESFIRERAEWCISRQRTWGIPIPALHDSATDEAFLDADTLDHIISVLDQKRVAHWWDGPIEDFIPPSLQGRKNLRKGTDTMDVWFDSGTSWSMLSNLHGEEQPDGPRTPDVCLEGSDQHRGWFQSLLLTRVISAPAELQCVPYKTLITHGFVMDEEGQKMSKSLGNVISPLTVIDGGEDPKKEPAYGTDVLRLWAASAEYTRDMTIGPDILGQAHRSLSKLRNTARFILGTLATERRSPSPAVPLQDMGLIERYMMDQLYELEKSCREAYSTFQFHRVVRAMTSFAYSQLSSFYLESIKDSLYADSFSSAKRRAIVTVLEEILRTFTSILAPIAPLLAEEIHAAYHGESKTGSIFMEGWRTSNAAWANPSARKDMAVLLTIRSKVLGMLEDLRARRWIKTSLEVEVELVLPEKSSLALSMLLKQNADILKQLFNVSDADVTDSGQSTGWSLRDELELDGQFLSVVLRLSRLEKCPRCWTYTREAEQKLCGRCANVCSSTSNAPRPN